MIQFQENTQTDRRTDGKTDERILFYRTIPTTASKKEKKVILQR